MWQGGDTQARRGRLCIPVPHFRNAHDPARSRCNLRIAAPRDASSNAGRGRSEYHSDLRTLRRPPWVGIPFRLANPAAAAVGRNTIATYEPCGGRRRSEYHSDLRTLPPAAVGRNTIPTYEPRRPPWVGIPFRLTNPAAAAVGRNTIPTCEPGAGRRRSEHHSDLRTLRRAR